MQSRRSNIQLASKEKFEERETWHKLVVKIISWADGCWPGGAIKDVEKIALKEWTTYYKRTLKINGETNRQKVIRSLNERKELIKKNGGFAW